MRPLVFFDLETTGVSIETDRIVDIAMIRRGVGRDAGSKQVLSSLVNPEVPIPAAATAIHHITDDMVRDAPTLAQLAPRIMELLEGADLAGYNVAKFDVPMLKANLARVGVTMPPCAVVDAFLIFDRMEKKDLAGACRHYLGEELQGGHRAEADAYAAMTVFDAQRERYEQMPREASDIEAWCSTPQGNNIDAAGKFAWQDGVAVITFSKHKGTPLEKLDKGMLQWMLRNDFPDDTKHIASEALAGRYPTRRTA